ncbi:MAG: SCO family protein [Planctomycetaceae bacterium]
MRIRRRRPSSFQFAILNSQFSILVLAGALALLIAAGCSDVSEPFVYDVDQKTDAKPVAKADGVKVITPKRDTGLPTWKGKSVADFSLTERSGKTITRADLLGKPAVVCFIFTHCAGPCTDVTGGMAALEKWLKTAKIDARLVTLSVDPKRDTPARLADYAKRFGAGKDWWFLTGDEARIYPLIRDSFGQPVRQETGAQRKPGYEVFHTASVMLVDSKRKIVEEYYGNNELSMIQLRQRLLLWKRTGSFDKGKTTGQSPKLAVPPEPKP